MVHQADLVDSDSTVQKEMALMILGVEGRLNLLEE
jgi:hypothetical protein